MQTIRALFGSKKFVAMLGGIVIYAAGRFGFDVSQDDADRMLGLVALYLGVQGVADAGKEAAKAKGGQP